MGRRRAWVVVEAGNFGKRFAKTNHQPLFEEFRETSQDMFGSHYQVYFPWDVCLNSSKSGMCFFRFVVEAGFLLEDGLILCKKRENCVSRVQKTLKTKSFNFLFWESVVASAS